VIRKVLIVDDSKLARMAVARILSILHPQWTRVEAADAEQALACIGKDAPDFVLLDYNMPGKDGLALASELREVSPGSRVAVISANHQTEVVSRAHSVGAAFLRKPLTESALAEFLNDATQREGTA
jgi:DNA-binding NarL/FixJ family response regulator